MTPRVAFVRVYVETLHSGRLKVTLTRETIWILSQELSYPYCMCGIEHFGISLVCIWKLHNIFIVLGCSRSLFRFIRYNNRCTTSFVLY